ncbi:MAG: TIGR02147 family protein [Fibrobacter sp.]|nr:TIGR02147 family protein [Fibrobacter sp.]
MKLIYTYIDYRKYLADYYQEKKETTRHFSYRYFAQRANIKSPAFLKDVILGKRNLTSDVTEKCIVALNLNKKESRFFRHLVLFNQAKSASEKQDAYSVMLSMMNSINEHHLTKKQYIYFEKWYYSVIRELVCIHDFKDNFELLAHSVYPSITTAEARKAVALLCDLSLIVKQKDNTYKQQDLAITSDDLMVALARRSFNSEMLMLAKNANETLPVSERNISGITMGISKACYDVLLAEMASFKERIKSIVNQDTTSTHVYQLNMQLFPLSTDPELPNDPERSVDI